MEQQDHDQRPDVGQGGGQNDAVHDNAPDEADAHMAGEHVSDVPRTDEQVQRNGEQNERHSLRGAEQIQFEQ